MNSVMSRKKWKIQTKVEQVKFILNPGKAQNEQEKKMGFVANLCFLIILQLFETQGELF